MRLNRASAAWLLLAAGSCAAQTKPGGKPALRDIDWQSFTYPFLREARLPRAIHWMEVSSEEPTVKLARGVHRFESEACAQQACPIVTYEFTEYGKLNGLRSEAAAVVLTFSPSQQVGWQLVYLFTMEDEKPKLLGWFEAGYRFSQGLKGLAIEGGSLVLDLYDPRHQIGDSCSLGFMRVRYRLKKGAFARYGDTIPGFVPFENCRSTAAPVLKRRPPQP